MFYIICIFILLILLIIKFLIKEGSDSSCDEYECEEVNLSMLSSENENVVRSSQQQFILPSYEILAVESPIRSPLLSIVPRNTGKSISRVFEWVIMLVYQCHVIEFG